ncbi:hypothetical protein BH11PSE13_BH11PSE13_41390 [soil metagenome]
MWGEVNLDAETSRDEWYLRCQLRVRPDDVRAADVEKINALLNKYMTMGDGAMVYLCQSLLDLDRRRAAHAQADGCLLAGLIDGVVDPLQDGVFDRLGPMFDIYERDADMMLLVNEAATTFVDAVQAQTQTAEVTALIEAAGVPADEAVPVR